MNARHLLMLAGLVGAAGLAMFGDKSKDTELVEPVAHRSVMPGISPAGVGVIRSSTRTEAESLASQQGKDDVRILSLQPRGNLLGTASGGHGEGSLFSRKSWKPPAPPTQSESEPPPPLTAPPLPFTYVGKQTTGGRTQVFLASGDRLFVVDDKTVIQNTYRVNYIRPPTLSLIYLPLNQTQLLSIGVTN